MNIISVDSFDLSFFDILEFDKPLNDVKIFPTPKFFSKPAIFLLKLTDISTKYFDFPFRKIRHFKYLTIEILLFIDYFQAFQFQFYLNKETR